MGSCFTAWKRNAAKSHAAGANAASAMLVPAEIGEDAPAVVAAADLNDLNFIAVGVEANESSAASIAAIGIDDAKAEFAVATILNDLATKTDSEFALIAESDRGLAQRLEIGAGNRTRFAAFIGAVAARIGLDGALRRGRSGFRCV